MKVCDVCGLPEELCVCEEIAREIQSVKVYTVRRRFGKLMTIVEGIDEHDIDIRELTKELKNRCACGGTAKKAKLNCKETIKGGSKKYWPIWAFLQTPSRFVRLVGLTITVRGPPFSPPKIFSVG